jgi:hypothetical protein
MNLGCFRVKKSRQEVIPGVVSGVLPGVVAGVTSRANALLRCWVHVRRCEPAARTSAVTLADQLKSCTDDHLDD